MTTLTPNYSLTTYAATGGDETSTFLNFRTALVGVSNSNMTKIDTALGNIDVAVADASIATITLKVFDPDETLVLGDGAFYFTVPPELAGMVITNVYAFCYTASTSGNPTVQIARGRRATASSTPTWVDVLSTRITIDINEYSSTDDATQPVINTANDDLATRDVLRIDIDGIGTGTKGLDIAIKLV